MARGNPPPGCRCETRVFTPPEEQNKPTCGQVIEQQRKNLKKLRLELTRQDFTTDQKTA